MDARCRRAVRAAFAAGALCAAFPGFAADPVGDDVIRVSLATPGSGLSCDAALAATRITFEAVQPPFTVTRISLLIDGAGAPEDAVDEQWPEVSLQGGLHEGENIVELVASDDDGHSVVRQVTVVAAAGAAAGSADVLPIACEPQQTYSSEPAPVPTDELNPQTVVSGAPRFVYETVPVGYPQVIVVDAPAPPSGINRRPRPTPPSSPPSQPPSHRPVPVRPEPQPRPEHPAPRRPPPVVVGTPPSPSSPPAAALARPSSHAEAPPAQKQGRPAPAQRRDER